MSQDRLERIRRTIEEFNAGALGPEFEANFVPDIKFRDELGELDNRADLRGYLRGFQEAFGGFRVELDHAQEVGETLMLVVNQSGRGAMSGVEVAERFTWLLTFRGERCVQWQIYADHAEALEAVGLRE
jgi:ketosteroid isomerase-like protein